MEAVLKNTSIIGTSISIQLEQWQLKRQWLELHQRQQQRAALQLTNSRSSSSFDAESSQPSLLAAEPSAIPNTNSLNYPTTNMSPSNFFHHPSGGFGTFTSGGNTNFSSFFPRNTLLADQNDDQQSLESVMGPARETDQVLLSMTLIYSMILFSGIIGNTITLYVIWRHPRMHAGATNYYLASLAVSDLISLVFGLPLEMFQLFQSHPYPLPEVACVARGWLTEMATNSSVLCILLFSFERYLAVVHPFQIRLRSRVYRALPLVVIAWLVAFVAAAPIALQLGIAYKVVNRFTGQPRDGTQLCIIKHPLPHSFQLSTFFLFVVPMLIIVVFHVAIVIKLMHASRSQGSLNRATSSEGGVGEGARRNDPTLRFSRGRRAVLRMLASVALAFFICYAPFHSQRLLASYLSNIVGNDPSAFAAYKTYLFISGILYYSASTVNPILYNILSVRFRRAFLEALIGCIPGCTPAHGSPTGSPDAHHRNARNHLYFQQLRRQYTNTGTNECNSIGGGGYDTDGYSMSSRVIALNVLNSKNTLSNGPQIRLMANGTNGHHHRRAGPCQSASNTQIASSNLLHSESNNNVVWRTNSFSSHSECENGGMEEVGTFAGDDENASADYSTTQSLELNHHYHQKRQKNQKNLSSSQRRRLLIDNSRNNSSVPLHNTQRNGSITMSQQQRANSHQQQQYTSMLSSTAGQRDRAVSFESTTAEIIDEIRMRTAPFLSPEAQQLDFDSRHRDSNASIDSIMIAKVTLSQRNSPTDIRKGGIGTQTALTLDNAVVNAPAASSAQTTPSHCSTTDRHFLGDTLTLKTEQLKQRVAIKKAARKAMRLTTSNQGNQQPHRQSISKHHNHHHQPANGHGTVNGGHELRSQQSVESLEAGKCGHWMNRAARKQHHRQQQQPVDKRHRKQATSTRYGRKPSAEKSAHVAVVFAPALASGAFTSEKMVEETQSTAEQQLLPVASLASEHVTFGSDSVFDYADSGEDEVNNDEEVEQCLQFATPLSVTVAASPVPASQTIPGEKRATVINGISARNTLTVKTSSSSFSSTQQQSPPVNIVISPPSVSSRSDSIHSGSISGNVATQV